MAGFEHLQEVLLIDDDQVQIDAMRLILERERIPSFGQLGHESGIHILRAHPSRFDISVANIGLDRTSGFSFAGQVRSLVQEGKISDISVVLTSGHVLDDLLNYRIKKARETGEIAGFLQKHDFGNKSFARNLVDIIEQIRSGKTRA